MAAVIRDVTSHQRVAQAMGEIENRFRNMADASPVLLWMAGTDGLCTFFNQTWLTFTGRTIEEEWGVGWAENVHFEDFAHCMNTYVQAFNARAVFEMEYRLRRHDGEYRWILDRGAPRYTPTGGFAGYIGSCIDITERRLLEQELRGAVQERDEFLSIASHELGTPITALRLLVETLLRALRRKIDERQTAEMVGAIEDQILRLSRLVETLLDVSRIAEGRLTLAPEPIDLTALVDRVVTRMTQVAVDAGCPVSFEAPGPVPGVWDRVRTEQVITNLLSNAFKYGAGKPVNVLVSADDSTARVRVVDRGIGIPVHKQGVIFERYERAAPKNHYGGFGLGLWITRRTLQEMGGTIRVESEEGAGALFEVELPRRQVADHANSNGERAALAAAPLPGPPPADGGRGPELSRHRRTLPSDPLSPSAAGGLGRGVRLYLQPHRAHQLQRVALAHDPVLHPIVEGHHAAFQVILEVHVRRARAQRGRRPRRAPGRAWSPGRRRRARSGRG